MRLLLITDTYPPARISGALQMRDMACALVDQGHRPVVLTPSFGLNQSVGRTESNGVEVLRVRAPRTKDLPYWRRALVELALPWILLRGLRRSSFHDEKWDGAVWYSPTIFLGPLIRHIKKEHGCPTYLILRDLFPDWAVDAGVMRKGGLSHRALKAIERQQYRQADVVGVQTPSNVPLIDPDVSSGTRVEVLHNWLSAPVTAKLSEPTVLGELEGRTNFVYAGNMGVAQDIFAFVELARCMEDRDDVGFVFVGRGSETGRLKRVALNLSNLRVLDEVDPSSLPALFARCHVGIISLHPDHATHNIPGKLLTYLHAGLPILARTNPNNDLVDLVEKERVGLVVPGDNPEMLYAHAIRLVDSPGLRADMGRLGQRLAIDLFSSESAARQVVSGLFRN